MSAAVQVMKPVGPVAGRFIDSAAYISAVMGPVGGGKTTASFARYIKLGLAQNAVWDDQRGCLVKKCRIAAVRDTYPNLDRTLIKSWQQWFPKTLGKWSGEAPRTHNFTLYLGGSKGMKGYCELDMELIFTAIGDNSVEDVLRGFELTGLHGNELDLLPRDMLDYGLGRIGRYPAAKDGGCARAQFFGDLNAPDEDNWVYDVFVNKALDAELIAEIQEETGESGPLIEFFQQPGAREPGAENLHNLPKGYYTKQMLGMSQEKIRRLIDNKFGAVRDGMPVYPEYSDQMHCSIEPLRPVRGLPLRIGLDAGLTPAAVIGQRNAFGQTMILAELATVLDEDDTLVSVGPTAFGEALADLLATRFPGFPIEFAAVDPAASKGTDGSGNEMTWLQTAAKVAKIRIRPAPVPNNSLEIRLEAVRRPLKRLIEAGRPGLVISSDCKVLRRGFNSGYKYRRTALAGGDGRYENKPWKNQYSHVHDALQYLMVASGEGRLIDQGGIVGMTRAPVLTVDADYNPFGG